MHMDRREFFRTGLGSLAGATLLTKLTALADEAPPAEISADAMADSATTHFLGEKLSCAESVLLAGSESLGIESDLIPDIALGLAGGVGLLGKTCGLISGSAMALSLAIAPLEPDYPKRKMRTMRAVQTFCKGFEAACGSTECRRLCGLDLTTPEGREALKTRVKKEVCAKHLDTAVRMLADQLVDELQSNAT